jgi:hypothetical protein
MINKISAGKIRTSSSLGISALPVFLYGFWFYSLVPLAICAVASRLTINLKILLICAGASFIVLLSNLIAFPDIAYYSETVVQASGDIYMRYAPTKENHLSNVATIWLGLAVIFPIFTSVGYLADRSIFKYFAYALFFITFLQVLAYYLIDINLDFSVGVEQNRSSYYGFFRPTALYFEPKDLAQIIFVLSVLVLNDVRDHRFTLAMFFTLLMTGSLAGLIYIFVLTILFYGANVRRLILTPSALVFSPFISLTLVLVYYPLLLSRFQTGLDASFSYKLTSVYRWLEFPLERKFFGAGLGYNDCLCLGSDLSFIWTLLFQGGVFAALILGLAFSLLPKNKAQTFFVLGLLMLPIGSFSSWALIGIFVGAQRRIASRRLAYLPGKFAV